MTKMEKIAVFDSTLRDGAQAENIAFTTNDKLGIVQEHKKWLISKNLFKSTTDEEVYDWEYEKFYGKPRKKQAGKKDTGRTHEKH